MNDIQLMKYADDRCQSAKKDCSDLTDNVHQQSTDSINTNIGGLDDLGEAVSTLTQAVSDLGEQVASLSKKLEEKETK